MLKQRMCAQGGKFINCSVRQPKDKYMQISSKIKLWEEGLFFFFITSGLVLSDEISVSKCLIIICKC